jgi:truncated hemoglobin YjbI
MTDLCDLSTTKDVRTLVDSFYDKVGGDELLAPVFDDFAHVGWATHLPDHVPLLGVDALRSGDL